MSLLASIEAVLCGQTSFNNLSANKALFIDLFFIHTCIQDLSQFSIELNYPNVDLRPSEKLDVPVIKEGIPAFLPSKEL